MAVPIPKYELDLECGHTAIYPAPEPEVGQELYCRKCRAFTIVVATPSNYYRHKCEGCHVARRFGADRDGAYRSASRHALKFGHIVSVYLAKTLLQTIGPHDSDSLPFETLASERQVTANQQQERLRRYLRNL